MKENNGKICDLEINVQNAKEHTLIHKKNKSYYSKKKKKKNL